LKIIELVAIFAGKIAAPHRNDMRQQRMVRPNERAHDHARSSQVALETSQTP